MKDLPCRFLWGILAGGILLALIAACKHEKAALSSEFLLDYIHQEATHPLFRAADSLKYRQEYAGAIAAYEDILSNDSLQEDEKWYAVNQLVILRLCTNTEDQISAENKLLYDTDVVPDGKSAADFCFIKGRWAMRTGDWKIASKWLLKSAGLYESLYGRQHVHYANCLDEIGILYLTQTDDPEEGKAFVEASKDIWDTMPLSEAWKTNHTLARALVAVTLERDVSTAGDWSDRAWPGAGQQPLIQAHLQAIAGRSFWERKNIQPAVARLSPALQTIESRPYSYEAGLVYKDIALYLARCSGNKPQLPTGLASYYAQSADQKGYPHWVEGSIRYNDSSYQDCVRAFEQFLNTSHRLNAKTLDNTYYSLADAYMNLGQYDKALDYAQKDHAIGGGDSSGYSFVTHALIGKIWYHKYKQEGQINDLMQAAGRFDQVDQLFAQNIPLSTEESGLQFQTQVGDDYLPWAMETCFQLYHQNNDRRFLEQGFRHAERMKSMLMYRDMLTHGAGQNESYLSLADSIRMTKGHITRLKQLRDAGAAWSEANEAEKKHWEDLAYHIQKKQRKMAPGINAIRQAISDLPGIQAALEADQMVLQYCFAGDFLYAIGIAPHQEPVFVKIPAGAGMKEQIALFHQQIQNTRTSPYALSAALGRQLLDPFSNLLGQCRQLLVIPDRELYLIPFEALQYPFATNTYLTERLAVSYTLSWKVYEAKRTSHQEAVDLSSARIALWRDETLQHGAELGEALERATSGGRIHQYAGNDCNTTRWKQAHGNYDILHFHTHGKSNLHNRDDNKLYFKPGQDSLQGYDIQAQHFKAYLAVLSACETALGDIQNREGAFTLARSFQLGGVQQVVATLWSVEEQQTVRLYSDFYRHLSQGESPAEALQEAKRSFIQGNGNVIRHPFFWAGPVLYR